MKNKSIISLVSFFLLSMFYVASANAGPTYVNVEVPKECGVWKYNASRSHHCAGTGKGNDVPAGTKGTFRCVGGGNGKGNLMIEMANCPTVIWGTLNVERAASPLQAHGVWLISGNAKMAGNGHPAANTKDWCIMKRRNYRCRI